MTHPEAHIQRAILLYLQNRGIYAFSVPNEAAGRSKITQMQLVTMGLKRGVADLVLLHPAGTVTFLEVKAEKGKQSDAQKAFQRRVEEHGLNYYVVRSVEEVEECIRY